MRVGVGFLQALDGDVRVDLRRREAGVAEQRLHAAQVRAAIEQMRGETVPQFVRTERDRNRGVPQITLQDQPDRARRNPAARFVDEKRTGLHIGRRAITRDGFQGRRADRADALLPPFAENAHRLGVNIQVGHIERRRVRPDANRCCKKAP